MTLVFMISDYDEYGANHVSATLDRSLLHKIIIKRWGCGRSYEQRKIIEILERDDESIIGKYDLSNGWGGVQLHIVDLTEVSDVSDIEDEYVPSMEEIKEEQEIEYAAAKKRMLEASSAVHTHVPDPALEGLIYDPNIFQWVKPST